MYLCFDNYKSNKTNKETICILEFYHVNECKKNAY